MDAQARDTWYRSLEYDNFPKSAKQISWSTFEQLHQNKDEVFERVLNVFRGLELNYKTNSPCKFGSKIIVNNLVRWDRWGFHLYQYRTTGRSTCRSGRMLYLFSGKPIPDNRENITIHLDDHIQSVQGKEDYEDEMFSIRYF